MPRPAKKQTAVMDIGSALRHRAAQRSAAERARAHRLPRSSNWPQRRVVPKQVRMVRQYADIRSLERVEQSLCLWRPHSQGLHAAQCVGRVQRVYRGLLLTAAAAADLIAIMTREPLAWSVIPAGGVGDAPAHARRHAHAPSRRSG